MSLPSFRQQATEEVPVPLIEDRRDYHATMSPAIYTHVAADLVDSIAKLPLFHGRSTTSPADLARDPRITSALSFSGSSIEAVATSYGIIDLLRGAADLKHQRDGKLYSAMQYNVFSWGLGDRHFAPYFASVIAEDMGHVLLSQEVVDEPLSMIDYADMMQTGWFGSVMNKLALTKQGVLQPGAENQRSEAKSKGIPVLDAIFKAYTHGNTPEYQGPSYEIALDDESGLAIVGLSRVALTTARGLLRKETSVGCPVARTSFATTPDKADWLEAHGYVGAGTAFVGAESDNPDATTVRFEQGAYTAIDEVVWQWGDYVRRYGAFLLSMGEDPSGIVRTKAHEVVLLD